MNDLPDDWEFASAPGEPVDVPDAVVRAARGAPVRCVWKNTVGGLTFEIPQQRSFIKWTPPGSPQRLHDEAERMRWAAPHTPVPEVLDCGTEADGSSWLLTAAHRGTTAVAPRWKASPRTAVHAIGEGLRAFHDALPVATCPYSWPVDTRAARAHARAEAGVMASERWHPSHRHLTVSDALAIVDNVPPIDALVVCHADACAPNTLIDDDGRWSGHVDLERMGTADRWADLAIATWSTTWNYGPGWEPELLAAYGINADDERTRYYRVLWDLTD